jgi:type II secretory ATPase GspE/PulE/Tfp pilus assembly ATPase PilB-like protein
VRIGKTELVLILPDSEANPPTLTDMEELVELGDEDVVDALTEDDIIDDDDAAPIGLASDDGDAGNLGGAFDTSTTSTACDAWPRRRSASRSARRTSRCSTPAGRSSTPAGPTKGGGGQRTVTDLFRLLLLVCFRGRATDVHLEPKGENYSLRLRSDGVMVDAAKLPNAVGVRLAALVKIISEIDPSQKTSIQEGNYSARVPHHGPGAVGGVRRVDYRVSFAPSVYGQKLVIRILDAATAPATVKNLMLPDWMQEELSRSIEQDAGMVLVCGPTGSGKTSTLYSVVRSLDLMQRNVITIEDPVEIQIENVTQLPVDEEKGKGFAELLRTVLRQDPDVILVGEIRDAETARTAMQASITGHLVFSTRAHEGHGGHDLPPAGPRRRAVPADAGASSSSSLSGSSAGCARSARRPSRSPTRSGLAWARAANGVETIYAPVGCFRCLSTGFAGRRAVFEMLNTTEELRDAIVRTPSSAEIAKALSAFRFQRLQASAYELVAAGEVAFDEADRAVGR